MGSSIFPVDFEHNLQLQVHRAVGWYIYGYDPEDGWDFRGIDGYGVQEYQQYVREKTQEAVDAIQSQDSLRRQFNDFVEECLSSLQKWMHDPNYLKKRYLSNKTFWFVLGTGRTGGTYTMRELSRALDWPYRNSLVTFTHDTMPEINFTCGEMKETMQVRKMFGVGWREPANYYNLVFQLIQYLVYIDREFGDESAIVKKTMFGWCLKLVDRIFEDRANYIVTVRHPGACARSWKDGGFSTEREKDTATHREKILYGWESCYRNIVRDGTPDGELEAIKYGPEMEQYLKNFFENRDSDKTPDECRVKDRNYDEYWKSDPVEDVIERVETEWKLHDLSFPRPKTIL